MAASQRESPDYSISSKEPAEENNAVKRTISTMPTCSSTQSLEATDASPYCGRRKCFSKAHKICGDVVNNENFQLFIVFLIILNAIQMGIATFDFVSNNSQVDGAFQITDFVFLLIFTAELGLQFCYHGHRLFLDGWLLFDFIIILLSWSLQSMQVFRAFRIFRVLRLINRLEILKNLVLALFAVLPNMFAITILHSLMLYIYTVMCTVLFHDLYERGLTDEDYFSRLDVSVMTLFQIMTLTNWSSVARQVMEVYPWSWGIFVSFVLLSGFIVYNLIIAVVCDSVHMIEDAKKHLAEDLKAAERKQKRDCGNVSSTSVSKSSAPTKCDTAIVEERPETNPLRSDETNQDTTAALQPDDLYLDCSKQQQQVETKPEEDDKSETTVDSQTQQRIDALQMRVRKLTQDHNDALNSIREKLRILGGESDL